MYRMRPTAATPKPGAMRPPDAASLRLAALAHLARFATTEAGLARLLGRKIDNWARKANGDDPDGVAAAAQAARACIPAIVRTLVEAGAISDTTFAQTRARSLSRAGRSRRAIGAHLATRGVPAALADAALPSDPAQDFIAALIHARKRRLGPWRKQAASPERLRRELGSLARAGFGHDVAARALESAQQEAEKIINTFRQDVLF